MGLLDDKVALVTGGGRGIGRATTELLAAEGARVAVADASRGAAEDVASGIEARGGEALAIQADVTQPGQIPRIFEAVLQRFGRLDVLHSSAGAAQATASAREIAPRVRAVGWDQVAAADLPGALQVARRAICLMAESRQGGRIILMGTLTGPGGAMAGPARFPRVAVGLPRAEARAAVACLTRSLARWAGPHGVLVNSIWPGVIDTTLPSRLPSERLTSLIRQTALRRMGTADEVAKVVLFLASDLASFVTGTHVDIDGGLDPDG